MTCRVKTTITAFSASPLGNSAICPSPVDSLVEDKRERASRLSPRRMSSERTNNEAAPRPSLRLHAIKIHATSTGYASMVRSSGLGQAQTTALCYPRRYKKDRGGAGGGGESDAAKILNHFFSAFPLERYCFFSLRLTLLINMPAN